MNIFLTFSNFFIFFLLYSYFFNFVGKNFLSISKSNFEKNFLALLFISLIVVIINFFYPINLFIRVVFLSVLLCVTIINFKKNYKLKIAISLILSFITILYLINTRHNDDTIMYHLPYTAILNDHKIIIGISNIHERFGWITLLQYSNAIFNFNFIDKNFLNISIFLFHFTVIGFFLEQIYKNINSYKKINILTLYSIFVIFALLIKYSRFTEWSNDHLGNLLTFLITFKALEILINTEQKDKMNNVFILYLYIAFLITIKNSYLLYLMVIPLIILINKHNLKIFFQSVPILISSTIVFIWLLKNILVSGCLVYPIKHTCFNFAWSTLNTDSPSNVEKTYNGSNAWAKAWPDRNKKIKIHKGQYSSEYESYSKNIKYWFPAWKTKHLYKIIEYISLFIILMLANMLYLRAKFTSNKYKNSFDSNINNINIYFISYFFITIIIWFFQLSLLRYGATYILNFIFFLFANEYLKIFEQMSKIQIKKFIKIMLAILFIVYLGKNTPRLINKNSVYNLPQNFRQEALETIKFNDLKIYFAKENVCMYSPSPCTHKKIEKNISVNKKKKYYIIKY